MSGQRKIIHIDMDAYYAAVEQRDHPEYRGKPIVVGGKPNSRGVVSTCSYEARKFGIHSGISCKEAYRRCPQAIFVYPRFKVYIAVSKQIRGIFYQYTDLVEPLSLDEAFLDVTTNKKNNPSATRIAQEIREKIKLVTGLTASAGVSYNKLLAKVASDYQKPDGLTVVIPERAQEFIDLLPVRKFFGIGKVTEKKMHKLGIFTGDDLKRKSLEFLKQNFGKMGSYYYYIARGIDNRPVVTNWIRKSVGREETFAEDILDFNIINNVLQELAGDVSETLAKEKTAGKTIQIKVRYANFETITRQKSLARYINKPEDIIKFAQELFPNTQLGERKIRLLGVSVTNLKR